jgi:hypothetical protein
MEDTMSTASLKSRANKRKGKARAKRKRTVKRARKGK